MTLTIIKGFIRESAKGIALHYGDDWTDSKVRRECIAYLVGAYRHHGFAQLLKDADVLHLD